VTWLWWIVSAAALACAALAMYVVFVTPHALTTSRVELTIADLPPELDGYTIGVLSDIHRWPGTSLGKLKRAVTTTNAASPDTVVLLGDYAVSWKTSIPWANAPLYRRALRSMTPVLRTLRTRDGVFAVLGNHDHYYDADAVERWLRDLGAHPLVNGCATVERDGATLVIGGVDDLLEGSVDPAGGCDGHHPDAPTVVLAHHPDSVLHLAPSRRIDLVLSGHTHGGQYVLPIFGAPITLSEVCGAKTAAGWVPNERAPLYVSRGIGEQTPGRLNCPPEVVILTLRRAEC
jgi:predicted MPP superfamily phosphohydrolase